MTFLGVMVPRLPNLFSFSGPGSPSVLANMVLHAEVQVDWAVGLMVAANNRGITEVEPRRDAARGMDSARRGGGRADAVPESRIVVVSGIEHRRQEARIHALHRRLRQLPEIAG